MRDHVQAYQSTAILTVCLPAGCTVYYSVEVKDISLTDYIQIRHAVYLPHTAGRYAKKQFKKAQMPIVERLVDRCVFGVPYGATPETKSELRAFQ